MSSNSGGGGARRNGGREGRGARSNGSGNAAGEERQGVSPRGRRAFGCVTWIYMATLAFLAVASFGMMPVWFLVDFDAFSLLEGISFYAILLFLPAMFFGALLGYRTYRNDRSEATRVGTTIGFIVGWAGFAFVFWLENVAGTAANPAYWLAVPPVAVAAVLLLIALFPTKLNPEQRRRMVMIGGGLVGITGLVLLAANFSPLQLVVAVVSVLAGAGGGWTAGIGYARAGGQEMLPPDAAPPR